MTRASNKVGSPHWDNWKWSAVHHDKLTVVTIEAPFGEYHWWSTDDMATVCAEDFTKLIAQMDEVYADIMADPINDHARERAEQCT